LSGNGLTISKKVSQMIDSTCPPTITKKSQESKT
jgi:hypothetical protein